MEAFTVGFAVYWIVAGFATFIYCMIRFRIKHGYVDKADFEESLLGFIVGGLFLPFLLIGDILYIVRFLVLKLFNIGSKK